MFVESFPLVKEASPEPQEDLVLKILRDARGLILDCWVQGDEYIFFDDGRVGVCLIGAVGGAYDGVPGHWMEADALPAVTALAETIYADHHDDYNNCDRPNGSDRDATIVTSFNDADFRRPEEVVEVIDRTIERRERELGLR